jgi:Calx-beta domain/Domain of unknown function (DUF4214)
MFDRFSQRFGKEWKARRRSGQCRPNVEALEERTLLHCTSAPADAFMCTPISGHEGLAMHIHPKVTITVNGQAREIPANLGIENGQMFPIHTHDNTGTLHVESPVVREFRLRHFFNDIWHQPFDREQVLDARGIVIVTVDGRPNTEFGELILRDNQNIVIRVTSLPSTVTGTLEFSAAGLTVSESVGQATITVLRSGGSQGAVSVNYAASNGTGLAGTHYNGGSGVLNFAAGETSKTFTVSIIDNTQVDGPKTVALELSNPTGGASLHQTANRAVLTINDDDTAPPPTPPPPTPPPPQAPVTTPQQRAFVTQIYRDVLRREVDPIGLENWAGQLAQGVSNTDVMMAIQSSPEARSRVVHDISLEALGRAPSADELNGALNAFHLGGTREQIKAALLATDEYFQQGGGTDEGFLETLYQKAFGRSIDNGGRATFSQALASGITRRQIAETIYASTEYRQKLVRGFFQQILNREAGAGEIAFWVEHLRAGATAEQVITGFVTSSEYLTRRAGA